MIAMFAAVSHRRVRFLVTALTLAALLTAAIGLTGGVVKTVLMALTFALWLGLLVVAASALGYHPAVLLDRPGERVGVVSPALVLAAAGYTFMIPLTVGDDIADALRGDPWVGDLVSGAGWAVALVLLWWVALGPSGVRLGPDGLTDRAPLGSLFVPWEALASAAPGRRNTVELTFRDREAVVRTGYRGKINVLTPTTDAAYLADAINSAVATHAARL